MRLSLSILYMYCPICRKHRAEIKTLISIQWEVKWEWSCWTVSIMFTIIMQLNLWVCSKMREWTLCCLNKNLFSFCYREWEAKSTQQLHRTFLSFWDNGWRWGVLESAHFLPSHSFTFWKNMFVYFLSLGQSCHVCNKTTFIYAYSEKHCFCPIIQLKSQNQIKQHNLSVPLLHNKIIYIFILDWIYTYILYKYMHFFCFL